MSVHLEEIENNILDKLRADLSGLKVISYPSEPRDFPNEHPKGAVLVRYLGSSYSEPTPNFQKVLAQDRTHEWEITLVTKSLRQAGNSHQGVYQHIEQIRKSLAGYTPESVDDATILYPIRDGFVGFEVGRWQYEMVFAFIEPSSEDQ